jgi:hypothetical protein
MPIEAIIDWIVFLPSVVKIVSAMMVLVLIVAWSGMRPGDPTS